MLVPKVSKVFLEEQDKPELLVTPATPEQLELWVQVRQEEPVKLDKLELLVTLETQEQLAH